VKPTTAVILSVYNRPASVLVQTLAALFDSRDHEGFRVVVVDDGSGAKHRSEYRKIRRALDSELVWIETSTLAARPETYHIGGHNNPAYCTNLAIDAARKLRLPRMLLLSSDVILEPHAIARAQSNHSHSIVLGRVVDSFTRSVYCASDKIWPMCWFVLADSAAIDHTRFDEMYLRGMAFEDNDFMARMFLLQGSIRIDDSIQCIHQSHPQTAYSDRLHGFKISEAYTRQKWGGIPFRPGDDCLTYSIEREREGVAHLSNPKAKPLTP